MLPHPRTKAKSTFLVARVIAAALLFALSAYASAANPLEIKTDRRPNTGALSPDGKTLVCDFGDTFKVFDTAAGKELATFTGNSTGLKFTPDGKYFVAGGTYTSKGPNHVTRVFDAATWQLKHELKDQTEATNFLRISADSKRLMLVTSKDLFALYVWNIESGGLLATIPFAKDQRIVTGEISPDGKTVQMMFVDKSLRTVDLATKKETTIHCADSGLYPKIVPSAGRVVGSVDQLSIIDSATGKTLPLKGDKDAKRGPTHFMITPDEKSVFLCASNNGTHGRYALWDLAGASMKSISNEMPMPNHGVWLSGDGKRAFGAGQDGSIRVIDVATMKETQSFADVYPSTKNVTTNRYVLAPSYNGSVLAYFDSGSPGSGISIFTIK